MPGDKPEKHIFALSGKLMKKGKNKSGTSKDKKGKTPKHWSDTNLSEGSSVSLLGEEYKSHDAFVSSESVGPSIMTGDERFTLRLITAFSDPRLSDVVNKQTKELIELNKKTNETIVKIDNRLETTERKVSEVETTAADNKKYIDDNKKEMADVRKKLDEFEQRDRVNNLIISGKLDFTVNKQNTVEFLNLLLEANITTDDINYIIKIGNDENNRIRVVFTSLYAKQEIVKKRRMLRNKEVWLNDDLTPMRSTIAYKARQAVKSRKIHQTWVSEGKILAKFTEDGPIKRITEVGQIPSAD